MYDIVIIGGGPAGMTAALYALRGEKKVLILEKLGLGGQIVTSNEVENYPAVKSISGEQFADNLSEQIKSPSTVIGICVLSRNSVRAYTRALCFSVFFLNPNIESHLSQAQSFL